MKLKKGKSETITPLDKHKREGKKLKAPMADIPNFRPRSWVNEALPEVLWAILLVSHMKREEALQIFREVSDMLVKFTQGNSLKNVNFDATHSGLKNLKYEEAKEIIKIIFKNERVRKILKPLLFYKELPLYELWFEMINENPSEEDWKLLKIGVTKTLFHQSQEATDCRWLKILFLIKSGNLGVPPQMKSEIEGYPNVGDMREVRPTIRATEIHHDAFIKKGNWSEVFWDKSLKLTSCEGIRRKSNEGKKISKKLSIKLNEDFAKIFNKFFKTLKTTKTNPKHDTIFGLSLYSWRLTAEICFGGISEMVSGRLALRSLVECLILLKYLSQKNDPDTWSTYRAHGIGQAKLVFLKLRELQPSPKYIDLKVLESIINEDVWVEFVSINLGHWDNINLRDISQKSGTKDLYDKYFVWPSNYNHAHWGAVRETVFYNCFNPLHRLHRIPFAQDYIFKDLTDDALDIFGRVLRLLEATYP